MMMSPRGNLGDSYGAVIPIDVHRDAYDDNDDTADAYRMHVGCLR